jgi:hypothetical protein
MDYYRLWLFSGLFTYVGTGGFKSYGLLQVMGYHSMGYLRFDCINL